MKEKYVKLFEATKNTKYNGYEIRPLAIKDFEQVIKSFGFTIKPLGNTPFPGEEKEPGKTITNRYLLSNPKTDDIAFYMLNTEWIFDSPYKNNIIISTIEDLKSEFRYFMKKY